MIELSGAALLEVATATAANKQSVAGKNHGLIGCDIAHAAVRMAGRRERTQRDTPDAELLAIDQRNGTLVDVLGELQHDMRLLVIGMRGETAHQASNHLGSNLERVVRALYRPILVVPTVFKRPEKVMMAFDGSKTMCRAVELLAASPLVRNLPVHVVMVGAESKENRSQLDWAIQLLREAGHDSCGAILGGDVETSLRAYKEEQGIGLLVMGAYGHSRIRHLLVGSTTTEMLRQASVPVLLLR